MLSFAQAGNTLWGFQLAWFLVLLTLAAVMYVLDAKTLSVAALLLGVALAVVGSLSSLQGLLIWAPGLLLLYYRRRSPVYLAVWAGAGVLTAALYFDDFSRSGATPAYLTTPHYPLLAIRFFFETIGDVLGVPLTSTGTGADLVGAFGCLIVGLALFALWSGGRTRDTESAAPVGLALIIFGLLFALVITYGRTFGGPAGAAQSRYTTYNLLIVVGIYLIYLEEIRYGSRSSDPLSVRTVLGVLLGGVIVLQVLFGFVNGIRWARTNYGTLALDGAVTADAGRIPGPRVQAFVDPYASVRLLRDDISVLSTHRLSFFSDQATVHYYRDEAQSYARRGLFEYELRHPRFPPASSFRALALSSQAQWFVGEWRGESASPESCVRADRIKHRRKDPR